jgi:hypothetical protein
MLFADRTRKVPLKVIAHATGGPHRAIDYYQFEWDFRERLIHKQRRRNISSGEDHQTRNETR